MYIMLISIKTSMMIVLKLSLELDQVFTIEEIKSAIRKLKCGKSADTDGIVNEYIKHSPELFLQLYVKLFNQILTSGKIPKKWLKGIIVPIYKNKGDPRDADNYRGITLVSCLAKLFTSLLNNRL